MQEDNKNNKLEENKKKIKELDPSISDEDALKMAELMTDLEMGPKGSKVKKLFKNALFDFIVYFIIYLAFVGFFIQAIIAKPFYSAIIYAASLAIYQTIFKIVLNKLVFKVKNPLIIYVAFLIVTSVILVIINRYIPYFNFSNIFFVCAYYLGSEVFFMILQLAILKHKGESLL